MSRFLTNVRQLASMQSAAKPTKLEAQQMELGRTFAVEVIDALRNGDKTPALMLAALTLAGKNQAPALMAGFIEEIGDAVAEGHR